MSRGLQMLVEEGSIPHALMLCGASGAEKSRFFIGNRMKTAFRTPTTSRKREKLPVVGRRNAESPVFYPSLVSETQNRPFSAFLPREKIKNVQFPCFSLERKSELLIFRVSP